MTKVWTYGAQHVSFEEMLTVPCPTCLAPVTISCFYLIPTGFIPTWEPTKVLANRPHKARRKALLRTRDQAKRDHYRSIFAAQQEFDLREYQQLRAWFQEHGKLFCEEDVPKPGDPVLPWGHD